MLKRENNLKLESLPEFFGRGSAEFKFCSLAKKNIQLMGLEAYWVK